MSELTNLANNLSKISTVNSDGKQTCVKWDELTYAMCMAAKPKDQSLPEYLRMCALKQSLQILSNANETENV